MTFSTLDLIVFATYLIFMMSFGVWISRKKRGVKETTQDYFLASKALPWWAVGGSLIASNISAEQFIGMAGSGYAIGLAIASYEFMAAVTLIIVAKFFLPVFLKKGIYTMPQFLEERYDKRVRTGLAFFWVLLFVFVNITSVLYLGGLAIQTILGIPFMVGVIGLAVYASTFSIFGGLKAVVWTDVIQVTVLILGGLLASVLVLNSLGGSVWGGLDSLYEQAPEKFNMIFNRSDQYLDIVSGEMKSAYDLLPGIGVLIGGMWIANLYYWGNNQYIIQRALAAKDLREAQLGTVFAAFLKVIVPIIVVIPGIAAFVLDADISKPDEAYPWVLGNYVTIGFKGLAFAALVAAIGSSLSSMVNSASTIFTLDIYRPVRFRRLPGTREDYLDASEKASHLLSDEQETALVRVGKITAGASLLAGIIVAPLLGNLDQAFQYIQEYTGFISPGVVAIFLFGMFWKKTSSNAAFWVVLLSIPLSVAMKFGFPNMPFMDRMAISFLILVLVIVGISLAENRDREDPKGIELDRGLFHTGPLFNIASLAIMGILAVIYAVFW